MKRVRTRRSLVAAIVLPTYLMACHSWEALPLVPRPVVAPTDVVRVSEQATGPMRQLGSPRIQADTLWGVPVRTLGDTSQPVAIAHPLPQLSRLEVRRFSTSKTIFLALGLAAIGALMTGAVLCGTTGGCTPGPIINLGY